VSPVLNTAAGEFPAATFGPAVFTVAGQGLVGNVGAPDIITVRYETAGTLAGDNVIDCTGNAPTGAAKFVNQLTIDANNYLACTLWLNGAQQPPVELVPGITNMTVLYGVQTGNGAATNSVDTYLNAAQVTNWSLVKSVQVTLTFVNPMATQPGQPATVTFMRTIDVMNRTGVIT
jgi:type IV pilus assembly protein PilW